MKFWTSVAVLALSGLVRAIELDLDSPDSIKRAAATAAYGMVKYYTGNNSGDVPGNLPDPYYWWEAGAMFGALVDYWHYTGDDSYNEITTQALLHQAGDYKDFQPPNQTRTLGNDDQAFWGMAAMTAAEVNYPNPPDDQPQWLALAQAVFNTQAPRWDRTSCGGGLKWQIFTFNNGYNYKNTISNGCFFNIASRLARYTGNQTYVEWAERAWNWTQAIGLVTKDYQFYDGTDDLKNCTDTNQLRWSYNAGIYLHGAAVMWNVTNSTVWRDRTNKIIRGIDFFFPGGVMKEMMCEDSGRCNIDQQSFKAYLARSMADTTKVAPFTFDTIMPMLRTSAQAAARQCSGTAGPFGALGNVCGLRWTEQAKYDGAFGVGQQMAAMEIFQSNLVTETVGPVSNGTGGTSRGDPAAGTEPHDSPLDRAPATTADRAGAWILTAVVVVALLGGSVWLLMDD